MLKLFVVATNTVSLTGVARSHICTILNSSLYKWRDDSGLLAQVLRIELYLPQSKGSCSLEL